MKITDIKQQSKNQDRYSVYVDGKYAFSLNDWQYKNSSLRIGDVMDQQELDSFIVDSEFGKIYELTMKWVAIRARSEWEIDDYLKKKTNSGKVKDMIKEKLSDFGQIDDYEFAKSWVASRRSLRSTSKLRLKQELRQKRVSDQIINQVIDEDETSDRDTLVELVAKKRRQTRYQDDEKLMAYLSRQGFSYDDIKQALQQQN